MRHFHWVALAAASAILAGCQSHVETTPMGTASASPVENYKEQRMREAMRGLDYSTGLVKLNADSAQIARRGTREDAARLAAEAKATFETNDFPAAIAAYTKAVIVDPTRAETYLGLSAALLPKGREKEAEAAIRTAILLAPKSIDARVALARLIDMRGESATTIAAWYEVLALDPKVAEAHGRLAIGLYYKGNQEEAQRHLHECEELGGSVPSQFKDMLLTELRSEDRR